MIAHEQVSDAGGVTPPATVKVWDPFVRVFHWSLASLVVAAFVTGETWERGHIVIGYTIAALLALRIVWGFVGSRHARFTDFVRGPSTVLSYLRDVAGMRAARYIGHNPAGAAMIVGLIVSLVATCVTGYMMTTKALWGAKWIEEVHEACAHVVMVLAGLHVVGVIVSSLLHGENLVRAMITGRKRAE